MPELGLRQLFGPMKLRVGIAIMLLFAVLAACGDDSDANGERACGPASCDQGERCCDHCTGACVPEDSRAFCPDDGDPGRSCADAGPQTTACGMMQCETASQICVIETPVGPGQSYSCQDVPAACASDRSCACAGATLCSGAFDVCSDGADDNTIVCECPQCQ